MLTKAASYEEMTAAFRWQIPEHYNIGVDACDKWAREKSESDRLALIHLTDDGKETRYSFRDMKRLSNRCANVLEAQGVEEGDRIAILHEGRLEQIGTPEEVTVNPATDFVKELFAKSVKSWKGFKNIPQ